MQCGLSVFTYTSSYNTLPLHRVTQIENSHSILKKTKVPYQGSWREVCEQLYSQLTHKKGQSGTFENLFSIQSLKISFIGFVIVPVMCILSFNPVFGQKSKQPFQKGSCITNRISNCPKDKRIMAILVQPL